ncbi:MAG: methyltransferase domain-containing protein [Gammaproteobacteria bacterium]|nr:methyltransferase domain-containing protein [Gammaproteobacteria bacterium]
MNDVTKRKLPENFFERIDTSPDDEFYREPRFVQHIDEGTIEALTGWYREFLFEGADVLDLMSSWVSHYPSEVVLGRVAGLGMNAAELDANPRLTERCVHDLNREPELPFDAAAFDRATIAVSVQYLVRPVETMRAVTRVLRPGGRLGIAVSHRMFPTKAVRAFHQLPPEERVRLVGAYLVLGGFKNVAFVDRSPPEGDPLWILTGETAVS